MGKVGARKLAIGASLAAAAGYIAGLLTAPKSGKETREDIKDAAESGLKEGEKQLKSAVAEIGELLATAKRRSDDLGTKASKELEELTEKAKTAREKARQVLSAIHEGDAEDQDLHSAMQDAQRAVRHLRVYLKK